MKEISAYPLSIAAEEIGCSEKYLVRLAAADQLDIYARLYNHWEATRFNSDMVVLDPDAFIQSRLCKVPALTFCDYLSNSNAHLDIVKSYDEPDIYYRLIDDTEVQEVQLVVLTNDVRQLLEIKAVQEDTVKQLSVITPNTSASKTVDINDQDNREIGANIDVVTRADLIDLVSLSKAIARYRNMTNGEACDFVTTKIVPRDVPVYDLSGSVLPQPIASDKRGHAIYDSFNQNWWNDPKDENTAIPGWGGISANEVAISKVDAEECFSMPSSAFEEPPSQQPPIAQLYVEKNEPSHDKSSQLRALNQASLLWSNADRDDKTTWTDTKDVIAFLVGKGFSKTLAVRGASIVRPDWAESGRIPKE